MPREKTVFQTDEIAHMWAHQSRDHARNPQDNHRFNGEIIYSYAEPIGRIMKTGRGSRDHGGPSVVALYRDRSWSNTTNRHQSLMRQATSHMPHFTVANIHAGWGKSDKIDHKDNIKRYQGKIVEAAQEAQRARSKTEWRLACLNGLVKEANDYAHVFKLKTTFAAPSDLDLAKLAADAKLETERQAKRNAKLLEQHKVREAEYRIQCAVALDCWINHRPLPEGMRIDALRNLGCSYMRVEGTEVMTTGGARVPLDHVKRALPIVLRLLARNEAYQRNGHTIHVGDFALDSIDTAGVVRCGCHVFERAEVERIAKVVEAIPEVAAVA